MTEAVKVKEHWDKMAQSMGKAQQATHGDIHLRALEIEAIQKYLKDGRIIDVGCGNGYSTLKFAKELPNSSFLGVDYSEEMLEYARTAKAESNTENVEFEFLDITQEVPYKLCNQFDIAVTERCLINLTSHEAHLTGLINLGKLVKPGGLLCLSEESIQAYNRINDLRKSAGLSDMTIQWHNLYLDLDRLIQELPSDLEYIGADDFSSSYYLGTRFYKAYFYENQGLDPAADVTGDFNRLAAQIPPMGDYGLLNLFLFKKK